MKKYCWNNNQLIEKTIKDRFLIRNINNESISLNVEQYQFLLNFSNKYISVYDLEDVDIEISKKFVEYLVKKKVLVEFGDNLVTKVKKNPFLYLKKILFISVPTSVHTNLEQKVEYISKKINIVYISKLALSINLLSIPGTFYLYQMFNFSISNSPRTLLTFFIGFIAALVHEFWIAVYIKKMDLTINRWFVKLVIGIFISIGTNWSSMLQRSKKNRIFMFLFSINMTFFLASIELVIAYLLLIINQFEFAKIMFIFSLGTQIFIGISLYPFLLKNDGYFIFQELTGVYRIRNKALSILLIPFSKSKYREWVSYQRKDKVVLLLWLILFIVGIFLIEYLISNAIRIII